MIQDSGTKRIPEGGRTPKQGLAVLPAGEPEAFYQKFERESMYD